jgi:hypothetical protein
MYPNPVHDNFRVSVPDLGANATILVYDVFGNKVRDIRFVTASQEVYVGDLSVGTFFVVIQNGSQIINKTIIKQ